jgi:hypothetical protein
MLEIEKLVSKTGRDGCSGSMLDTVKKHVQLLVQSGETKTPNVKSAIFSNYRGCCQCFVSGIGFVPVKL